MVQLSKEAYDNGRAKKTKTKSKKIDAPVRDTLRIQTLQQHLSNSSIISMAKANSREYNELVHCNISYKGGNRSAKEFFDFLVLSAKDKFTMRDRICTNESFDFVYLDYNRMPIGYAARVYTPLLTTLLPALLKKNIINENTKIFIPNYSSTDESLIAGFIDQQFSSLFRSNKTIKATDYPLYVVSHALEKKAEKDDSIANIIGNYNSEKHLKKLKKGAPFIVVQYQK